MTLQDYIRIFRQRWPVIVVCAALAGVVTWFLTPADSSAAKEAPSYTATATLLVASLGDDEPVSVDRVVLYVKTGAIPTAAAKVLGFEGDPAILASQVTVAPDPSGAALTIAATDKDGEEAAATANAFADQTIAFFEKSRPGVGRVSISPLQKATPIPDEIGGGFVVPPSRPIRTALAGLVGLLLGFALALVLARVDSRLRTRDEVHGALRLPIIAEVPRLTRSQKGARVITVAADPLSPYSDAYRAARTALMHTVSQQAPGDYLGRRAATPDPRPAVAGARLILVTSGNAAEGKTTTVANLAASFAETGQRVLVLDADLRSPSAHEIFDVPQGAGISDYLSDADDTSLEAFVRPTSVPGVRIITAGTRLAHPASLASRMGHLLAEAREMADVVVIDTAPLLAASDVFDILPIVDTVLLVVRSGRLTEVAARRVAELLGRFQVPISGVVLVAARGRRADGYGHSYRYGDSKRSKREQAVVSPYEPASRSNEAGSAPEDDWRILPEGGSQQAGAEPTRRSRRSSSTY